MANSTKARPKAPARRKPAVKVPATRKIRGKTVAFNPRGIVELPALHTFEYVADSISFWYQRLEKTLCPGCGVVGTLEFVRRPFGLTFECSRVDKCEHIEEIKF